MPKKAQRRQRQKACFVVCKFMLQVYFGIWGRCVCKGGVRGGNGCSTSALRRVGSVVRGNSGGREATHLVYVQYQVPAWEGQGQVRT